MPEENKVKRQASCTRFTQVLNHNLPDDLVAAISVFLESTGKPDNWTINSLTCHSGYAEIKYIFGGQCMKIIFSELNSHEILCYSR